MHARPNIVLVHGAWADGSCWSGVIERLQADGYHVTAPQFPLTALADDVARLRQVLDLQDGPAIVAGHSYGGLIGLQLALDAPEAVHSLALFEPALLTGPAGQAFAEGAGPIVDLYQGGDTEGAVSAGGLYNPSKSVGPLEACWALQPLPDMQNTPASNKLAYMIFITTLRAQKDGTKFPPPRRAGPQVETGGLAKVSMVDHSSFNRLSRNRRSRSERYRRMVAGSDIFTLSDRVGLLRWLALARTAALSWLWCP
jgi:pimeloyl-ACP methyl ester carboxylesterase